MDEVEAVAQAVRQLLGPMWCGALDRAGITDEAIARAAIAALDACRSIQARAHPGLHMVYGKGREAGLREAAALAQGQFVGGPWLAERILALIDKPTTEDQA